MATEVHDNNTTVTVYSYINVSLTTWCYSGTSLNGPSEMQTTSIQWTARKAPFDFSMRLVHL